MADNKPQSKEKKNADAVEFVRTMLVSLFGQPADEATINAAAKKVVRTLPQDTRRTQAA
jgi:hypothetical protein